MASKWLLYVGITHSAKCYVCTSFCFLIADLGQVFLLLCHVTSVWSSVALQVQPLSFLFTPSAGFLLLDVAISLRPLKWFLKSLLLWYYFYYDISHDLSWPYWMFVRKKISHWRVSIVKLSACHKSWLLCLHGVCWQCTLEWALWWRVFVSLCISFLQFMTAMQVHHEHYLKLALT